MRHEAATWRVGERRLDKEERAADSNQVLGSKPWRRSPMLRADMRAAAVGGIVDSSARGSYLTSLSHRPYQWLADPESSWRTAIGSAASGVHMQSETAARGAGVFQIE